MLGIECEAVRVPGKRRAAELCSQPLPLQLTDETHLPESMSSEQTVIFVTSRNTALSYVVCVHFHVAGSVSSRSEFPRSSMAGSSCMRGWVRRCQIPLAVGTPSVMYENACLPTAHGKHCRPCLSGPTSPFLPHSGASLCTPSHLRASPISYLSTPPSAYPTWECRGFPTHGPLLCLTVPGSPVPPWAQDLGGSSLGVRRAWSSNHPETHTQTSLWRRETQMELRTEVLGAWES